jgi:hypothetical protein
MTNRHCGRAAALSQRPTATDLKVTFATDLRTITRQLPAPAERESQRFMPGAIGAIPNSGNTSSAPPVAPVYLDFSSQSGYFRLAIRLYEAAGVHTEC